MDINLEVGGEHVSNILNYAARLNIPILVGADTNCHTIMFGPESNRRGLDLEELILNNGLRVENVGTMPTFETIRGNKLISNLVRVAPDCNRSYCEDSFSGYSGSV